MSVPTDSFAQTSDEKSAGEWHETLPDSVGEYLPGSEAEKKLLRKLDMRIVVRLKASASKVAPQYRRTDCLIAMCLDLVSDELHRSS